jgi:biotin carboxylase
MLGGSYFQVPAIKYAKDAGYYVITCDYLPENPGHKYADEYYNISTTNLDGVLELASKLNIDGIVAYASDPAAPTAAYVSEKLGLPGNPYNSIKILTEKDLFRDFLKANGFNVPLAKGYISYETLLFDIDKFTFPIMIKPVDSSGSKGVFKVISICELKEGFDYAISFSRGKRVVVEEFILNNGPQLHGDAFVVDGEIKFCYLGDHHYNLNINPFVPYSTTLPSIHSIDTLEKVEKEIQNLVSLMCIKQGAFNIEARIGFNGKLYLMEVGPRNGGNLVPQLEYYASGYDMISGSVDIAVKKEINHVEINKKGYFAYYVLHSEYDGILENIEISDTLNENIMEKHEFITFGKRVKAFNGSNATLGILLLKFSSMQEMQEKILNMDKYVKVNLQ